MLLHTAIHSPNYQTPSQIDITHYSTLTTLQIAIQLLTIHLPIQQADHRIKKNENFNINLKSLKIQF